MLMHITVPENVQVDTRGLRCACGTSLTELMKVLKAVEESMHELSFADFMNETIFTDAQFTEGGMDDVFLLFDLKKAFKDKKPSDIITLGKSDYEKVMKVVRKPKGGYNPTFATQIVPFLAALRDATEKDPKVKDEEPSSQAA